MRKLEKLQAAAKRKRVVEEEKQQATQEAMRKIEELQAAAEKKRVLEEEQCAAALKKQSLEEDIRTMECVLRDVKIERERIETAYSADVRPSREEFEEAVMKMGYHKGMFAVAVTGVAGSGKSSLVNVFLNQRNGQPTAAPTAVVGSEPQIRHYADPGHRSPQKWIVWYDVPGGGTRDTPVSRYFHHQCLFVFDLVIVVVGDRVTQLDLDILRNCAMFGIPSFIVRSKADQQIKNYIVDYGYENSDDNDEGFQQWCRDGYIDLTRRNVVDELSMAGLPPQPVYIVSCSKEFRAAYSAALDGPSSAEPADRSGQFMDEWQLIADVLLAASKREWTEKQFWTQVINLKRLPKQF